MTSELDKLTYSTIYRQDYGTVPKYSGVDPSAEAGKADCKPKVFAGSQKGYSYENHVNICPCRAGGNMPPRGAAVSGAPTNLDKACWCKRADAVTQPSPPNKEELAEMVYKAAETGIVKEDYTSCHNRPDLNPLRQTAAKSMPHEALPCPQNEKFTPLLLDQSGKRYEGPPNKESETETKHFDRATHSSYKACVCPPSRPEGGPQEYGQTWIRERGADKPVELRMTGGTTQSAPAEVAKTINPEPPAGSVSCAPEVDISKFDQPNTFMRKLYDKYPYLYQILRDTPPEELISRVFKDRFLSTYQVDYLHMGVGKEHFPKSGEMMDEKFVSPDTGEEEPKMIPGYTHRPSKKANFGKKKSDLKTREIEEEDKEKVKEEPRVSEYMASISRLGGEIITDKLYKLEIENRKQIHGKGSS